MSVPVLDVFWKSLSTLFLEISTSFVERVRVKFWNLRYDNRCEIMILMHAYLTPALPFLSCPFFYIAFHIVWKLEKAKEFGSL